MKEIPQKGWYLLAEEGNFPNNVKVYFEGKQVGGIQRIALEIDAGQFVPVIKMEVIPVGGLVLDGLFPPLKVIPPASPEQPLVFTSSVPPEEVLKTMCKPSESKEEPVGETKTEVL